MPNELKPSSSWQASPPPPLPPPTSKKITDPCRWSERLLGGGAGWWPSTLHVCGLPVNQQLHTVLTTKCTVCCCCCYRPHLFLLLDRKSCASVHCTVCARTHTCTRARRHPPRRREAVQRPVCVRACACVCVKKERQSINWYRHYLSPMSLPP